ncbi:hypothetical protein I553_1449 [Mycobacterium xenopi 4042]|uniref:Uncharacterized protein n=1 Tax=Mycobacterium xenopi 4042 TaxID=1299334 RepID=X8CF36_MYCXE|nr:hypothetical protein I553_1449 [Mycobacterium xenopi 4042]
MIAASASLSGDATATGATATGTTAAASVSTARPTSPPRRIVIGPP